jgi:hypothetical protein
MFNSPNNPSGTIYTLKPSIVLWEKYWKNIQTSISFQMRSTSISTMAQPILASQPYPRIIRPNHHRKWRCKSLSQ